MSGLRSVGAITLFAEDVGRAKAFYRDVFELEPIFEDESSAAFRFDNTIVNVLSATDAHELVEPASVAPGDAGASFQLTIWVDDADAAVRDLASRGVRFLNGPVDRPWGVRTAAFADPAGHVWEVAQQLSG